jgi:PAS domain S-box-containing protein
MNPRRYLTDPRRPASRLLLILASIIAVVVFCIDALTSLDIAIAVLYVVVVLLTASTGMRRTTVAVAWGCIALTLIAYLASHDTSYFGSALARCLVSMLAVGTTAYLALRNQSSTATLLEQVQLLDLTHDAIVVYDLNNVITFWNRGAEELYGWPARHAIGKTIHDLVQTEFPVPVDVISGSLLSEDRWEGELVQTRSDESLVTVSSRWSLWRDVQGRPLAILATNNDVTQRKQMEAEIMRQQRELRATIDAIPGMVWSSGPDGCVSFINERWSDMGISLVNLRGELWRAVVHPDDVSQLEEAWSGARATSEMFSHVARMRRGDGVYRWLHIRGAPLMDEDGRVLRWYGVNTDIEERKLAEEALERSEAFLARAQGLSHTGSIGMKIPGGEMSWSVEACRIFGYPPGTQPSRQLVMDRIHPEDAGLVHALFERAMRGEPHVDVEHRLLLPDGAQKYVHFVAHAMTSQSGQPEYVGALMDVTESKMTQEALHRSMTELAHATRVTTLGELTASIAHEVSQPISAIVTNGGAALRWMTRDVPDWHEASTSIEAMIRDARRASDIIRRIRTLVQKHDLQHAVLGVNAIVEESIELVRHELQKQRTELAVELSAEPLYVLGDRVQLQQVVINLLINGVQAMAAASGARKTMLVRTSRPDPAHVLVLVRDSGTGITDEDAGRLFNAFFTTKPEGMGMGLSICRSIVEAHGGRIWAESNEEHGATLQFTLPLHPYSGRCAPDDSDELSLRME